MPRPISKVAPQWWDYTTLDNEILADAVKLDAGDLFQLSREGFDVALQPPPYARTTMMLCANTVRPSSRWRVSGLLAGRASPWCRLSMNIRVWICQRWP
jgi:glucosamine-6-phosphate deaminase